MNKNSILPKKSGSSTNQKVLTDKTNLAYFNWTDAKNIGRDYHPAKPRRISRHLSDFFCACSKLVHCAIMTDCIGELLALALSSPRPLVAVVITLCKSVTFRLSPKATDSNLTKEAV